MATWEFELDTGTDDGRAWDSTGWSSSANPAVGQTSANVVLHSWFRFPNVTIPQGATVSAAHIHFERAGHAGTSVLSNIYAIAEDDHTAPTSRSDWDTDHSNHTTGVVYDFDVYTGNDEEFDTVDISTVIQAILDRSGWSSGNDIGIHIDDDGTSADNWQMFGDVEDAFHPGAKLVITYTGPLFSKGSSSSKGAGELSVDKALEGSGPAASGGDGTLSVVNEVALAGAGPASSQGSGTMTVAYGGTGWGVPIGIS